MAGEPSLKTRALGYLARREHSRLELEKKLAAHAKDPAELSAMLDALEQLGFLSARRMLEQVVQVRRKKFGSQRIVHELREKGIAEDLIATALPALKQTELDAAREVWRKRFAAPPTDAKEHGKQMRFLLGRGFAPEVIRRVLLPRDE
ncbi:MAG: recombination regulator RecX [Nitrosomonadaceae bacterium]|nr:MAG: recombination regulator RecX [Nitrosomonadaceae bacterium]